MLKLTKYTLFHYFKNKSGLVLIENNHFVQYVEEISATQGRVGRTFLHICKTLFSNLEATGAKNGQPGPKSGPFLGYWVLWTTFYIDTF